MLQHEKAFIMNNFQHFKTRSRYSKLQPRNDLGIGKYGTSNPLEWSYKLGKTLVK